MRESIGSVFLYNVIIIFLVVTFAFLSGTLAYMKAFKANSRIVNAIEKYEGYNDLSVLEIERTLATLGYLREEANCKQKDGIEPIKNSNFLFCVYHYDEAVTGLENKDFYGVQTYMYFDLPFVGRIRIPLYAKTEKVYRFSN